MRDRTVGQGHRAMNPEPMESQERVARGQGTLALCCHGAGQGLLYTL